MASACVNNVSVPPSYGCFNPRTSFNLDHPRDNGSDLADPNADLNSDPNMKDFIDFEFHLFDPVAMLPADELFSDGKLVPLHLAPLKPAPDSDPVVEETRMPNTPLKSMRRGELIGSGLDSFAVSPKAPTCSSRWRELLRIKRQQHTNVVTGAGHKTDSGLKNPNPKSLKHFLNRNTRSSSSDPNLSQPLLHDSEPEPISISSRLSLSSTSSSAPEPDELPRLSLDAEHKPNQAPILLNRNPPKPRASSRIRSANANVDARASARAGRSPVRRSPEAVAPPPRCASVDSPRMNASGKVVFQGLGRSSSSPSTFNGGPRIKHQGMDRSYSANVRVTPVLNVPVCSLRGASKSFGFGQLFSVSGSVSGSKSSGSKAKN